MAWVCLPVGKIKHLVPAALSALIAAHPIPAGVECHCTGTSLAWVPDAPAASGPHTRLPGASQASAADPGVPHVAANWDTGNWGYHGPDSTPPALFLPIGGIPGGGSGGPSGNPLPPSNPRLPPPNSNVPPGEGNTPPSSVPEPPSAALLAVAAGALLGLRRRHRRRA